MDCALGTGAISTGHKRLRRFLFYFIPPGVAMNSG
jgi:hypothetical protein